MKPNILKIEMQETEDKQGCTCWSVSYADDETGEMDKLHFDVPVAVGEAADYTLLKELLKFYIVAKNRKSDYSDIIKLLNIVGRFADSVKVADLVEVIASIK